MASKILLIFVCMVTCRSAWGADSESRVVSTEQGPVRGYKDPEYDVFAFYDIPYARAPTGRDRYKAPLPPLQRTEIFEAIDRGTICPQLRQANQNNKTVREDCLITNIYIPDTNETNLPVMVNFHGGAYTIGFGELVTTKAMVQTKKMISINFNYRLGVHGFLCLGTKGAPGNAGLKDQVALLRWVKANIANFGGNPDDVTAAGCSAGGSSIDLLTVSKAANGLFKKVIAGSSAHLSAYSVQVDPLGKAKENARELNFSNVDDIDALEEFYLSSTFEFIWSSGIASSLDGSQKYAPCVEKDIGEERILEDAPYNVFRDGTIPQLPTLYGFTDMEGLMRMGRLPSSIDLMNEDFQIFLPPDLQFDSEEQRRQVAERVKNFYFGDKPVSWETVLPYIDYFTDTLFGYSMLKSVSLHAESTNSPVYLYEYSFVDENTPIVPGTDNVRGATHCTQETAVRDEIESNFTDEYKNMKAIMRDMWLNFILSGNPTPSSSSLPTWPTSGPNSYPFMQLTFPPYVSNISLLGDRRRFWDDIYEAHRAIPIPPSVTDSAVSHIIQTKWIICILAINFVLNYI